jgi:hypothetical protein
MSNPTQSLFSSRPGKRDKVKSKVKKLFPKMGLTSRNASPSPSQATGSANPTRSERIKDIASVVWSGIETSLTLLKECSDWNPILKSAVGGIVACIDLIGVGIPIVSRLDLLTAIALSENFSEPKGYRRFNG